MATTTLAKLVVKLEAESSRLTTELEKSNRRLSRWEKKTSSAVDKVKRAFIGLASVATLSFATKKVFDTVSAFEKLEASLKTVTGSTENAAKAMNQIRNFTATTPFQVQEVTDAFIKLKALGLNPSEEALRSYGNTASAMGKSLNQMIEAIADAATGEFERLKEFGIKANTQGENVIFTFQGVSTKVKKNASDIEGYLRNIGNVQFAGAMAEQMDTLGGLTSNLSDRIDNFMVKLGEAGLTKIFKDAVIAVSDFVKKLTESDYVINTLVNTAQFLYNVVGSIIIAFKDIGNAIGAFAAATTAILAFDFDSAKRILELRDQEKQRNDEAIQSLWNRVKATEDANNAIVSNEKRTASQVGKIYDKSAEDRIKKERQVQIAIQNMQASTWQNAATLLREFAGDSREAALAVIAIEKGLAISQVIMSSEAAKARALADLGPVAGAAYAGKIELQKNISIGLITATGLVQASKVGSSGAAAGTYANPTYTQTPADSNATDQGNQQGGITYVNIDGYGVSEEGIDALIDQIYDATERRDKIIISRNSRNRDELVA